MATTSANGPALLVLGCDASLAHLRAPHPRAAATATSVQRRPHLFDRACADADLDLAAVRALFPFRAPADITALYALLADASTDRGKWGRFKTFQLRRGLIYYLLLDAAMRDKQYLALAHAAAATLDAAVEGRFRAYVLLDRRSAGESASLTDLGSGLEAALAADWWPFDLETRGAIVRALLEDAEPWDAIHAGDRAVSPWTLIATLCCKPQFPLPAEIIVKTLCRQSFAGAVIQSTIPTTTTRTTRAPTSSAYWSTTPRTPHTRT
ncbi:hypothetical protein BC828DRAFT_264128 [Blastocladiella britannica]|nr:hypothetical protein BC828DRAFT_264128 [Blastocladiella britannica]